MDGPQPPQHNSSNPAGLGRRSLLKRAAASVALAALPSARAQSTERNEPKGNTRQPLRLKINGQLHRLEVEPRVTLLDALRETIGLTGTKKGCNHGQCGACTVLIDGVRVVSCLTLAHMAEGSEITTIEGLADTVESDSHPLQTAFVEHDALQCGFCTSGQIMSGVGCINEGHATSRAEIREHMSGNLCRCAAYPNIVTAIETVAKG